MLSTRVKEEGADRGRVRLYLKCPHCRKGVYVKMKKRRIVDVVQCPLCKSLLRVDREEKTVLLLSPGPYEVV